MRRRNLGRLVLIGWVAAGAVAAAHAQRNTSARAPNAARPSDAVGLVGGLNTRSGPTSLESGRVSTLQGGVLGGPSIGRSRSSFGFRRGIGAPSPVPSGLLPSRPMAFNRYQAMPSGYMRTPNYSRTPLAELTGYALTTNWNTPEGGWGFDQPPLGVSRVLMPEPETSPFRALTGLAPAPPEETRDPNAPLPSMDTVLEEMAQKRAERITALEQRAYALFKEATTPNNPRNFDQLADCQRLLQTVLDFEPQTPKAAVLLIHIALERRQMAVAHQALNTVVRRFPETFTSQPDLAAYFSTPEAFRAQMRQFRQLGDYNVQSAEAWVLAAYCNWALNDLPRCLEALDRAQRISESAPNAEVALAQLSAFRRALEPNAP